MAIRQQMTGVIHAYTAVKAPVHFAYSGSARPVQTGFY